MKGLIDDMGKGFFCTAMATIALCFIGMALLSDPWWVSPLACFLGCVPIIFFFTILFIMENRK